MTSEIEFGVADPTWAAVMPVDPGTRRVGDEMATVWDPSGILGRLAEACRTGRHR